MTGYQDSVSHHRLCECQRCNARAKLRRLMADPRASRAEIDKLLGYIGNHRWLTSLVVQAPNQETVT